MEAALFRAAHETNLLRTRLDRILGKDATRLSKNDARRAILFVLAEGSGHSGVDREKTISLLSSSLSSSPKLGDDPLPETEQTRDGSMDVDHGTVGGANQAVVASPRSENLLKRNTQEGIQSSKLACEDYRLHDNQLEDQPMVDRKRLVDILAAEERVNIMVNHLGSSHTAWLDIMHSRYSLPPKGARTGSVEISNGAVGFPPLSVRGAETANEGRPQGEFVSSPKALIGGESVMFGMVDEPRGTDSHRRKKKRRSERQACVGNYGQRRERGSTLGGHFEQPGTIGVMSMLSRSATSAVDQESLPGPGGGGEHTGPCSSSLPRLDVSRLNG